MGENIQLDNREVSRIEEEKEIRKLFYDNFLSDIEEDPEFFEFAYGVSIDKIKADPEYYYNLKVPDKKEIKSPPPVKKVKREPAEVSGGFLL